MAYNLPPEILEKIFQTHPELIHNSIALDRYLRELMKPSFLMEIYKKPITGYEILKYIETQPDKFAIFTFIPSEFFCSKIDLFRAKFYIKENESIYSYFDASSYLYDPHNILIRHPQFNLEINNTHLVTGKVKIEIILFDIRRLLDETTMIYLDLLSLYKILLKRAAHIQIDGKEDFAKQAVLKYFDSIVKTQWSQFEYLTHMQLYLYLMINADILNIQNLPINLYIKASIYKLELDPDCKVLYYQLNGSNSDVKEKENILNSIIKNNEILINEIRKTIHEL